MPDFGLIKFQIADIQFGMFADQILEIVRLDNFRPIPKPLPYIVGLMELRNYIVTVVDFRKRLGLSPLRHDQGTTMIVVKLSSSVIGLLVESISNFKRVPEEDVLSPFSIAGLSAHLLQGVLAVDEDIMIIPDLDKIFSSYIPMHLSSITPSEKIAFQYRSTPGAISRTLENTLVSQGYLDEDIILKLPRSMSLPSVQVHKFISYYPDFQPSQKTHDRDEAISGIHQQQTKAADESYTSLSKRLESQQQHLYPRRDQQPQNHVQALLFSPKKRGGQAFETLLQQSSSDEKQQITPQQVLSEREVGRQIAKSLRVTPVRLNKYFTYYPHSSITSNCYPSPHDFFTRINSERQSAISLFSLDDRLNELLRHSRYSLQRVLQTLEKEGYALQQKALRRICEHYQVSQIAIARLRSNFPELRLDFTIETEKTHPQAEEENTRAQNQIESSENDLALDSESRQKLELSVGKMADLNVCLQELANREKLEDNRAVRYAAAQFHTATCRLSKLRSYYRFRGK